MVHVSFAVDRYRREHHIPAAACYIEDFVKLQIVNPDAVGTGTDVVIDEDDKTSVGRNARLHQPYRMVGARSI